MNNNKRLFALAWTPALSLFAAVTLADVSGLPLESGNAVQAEFGEIKNRNQCPSGTTFFKNKFPSLTNGNPGGSTTIDFTVDGEILPVTVTWNSNNSFGFEIDGGVAYKVGVTVDTNNFIYDYTGSLPDGRADTQINFYGAGLTADDVNHLDLCLATVDSVAPEVGTIRVEPSSDGTTVSGTISIIASVFDESGLDSVTIEIVGADGVTPIDPALILGPTISGNEYTWTLNTSLIPAGDYTIKVTAKDVSILANVVTREKDVTVVRSVQDCLEGPDGVPPGQTSLGGCNITGYLQLEYPNEVNQLGPLPVTQAAIPVNPNNPNAQNATCGLSLNGPFELVAKDPRVDDLGNVIDTAPLDLSTLFDIAGHYVDFHPNELVPQVVLRADTVGSPCLTLLHQDAPEFSELTAVLPNGGVYTVTQFPELVPGMYDGLPRITAPLSDSQPDLQFVEQAALQTDDRFLLVEEQASPFTSDVFNASRTRGFKGTFFPLNTREVCLFLDPALGPDDGAIYFEAVLQCKIDLAVEYFFNLEQALIEAEPNLISPSLNTLLTDLNKARSMVKVRRWNKAEMDLTALFNEVRNATWNVDDRNDPGNLIMRIDNLFFRIQQLEEAENRLP
jgi:hypothetical protein